MKEHLRRTTKDEDTAVLRPKLSAGFRQRVWYGSLGLGDTGMGQVSLVEGPLEQVQFKGVSVSRYLYNFIIIILTVGGCLRPPRQVG